MTNKKSKAYLTTCYIFTLVIILSISYGSWRLERYINWKFGYKAKVNQRIELLEKRIEKMEKRDV